MLFQAEGTISAKSSPRPIPPVSTLPSPGSGHLDGEAWRRRSLLVILHSTDEHATGLRGAVSPSRGHTAQTCPPLPAIVNGSLDWQRLGQGGQSATGLGQQAWRELGSAGHREAVTNRHLGFQSSPCWNKGAAALETTRGDQRSGRGG